MIIVEDEYQKTRNNIVNLFKINGAIIQPWKPEHNELKLQFNDGFFEVVQDWQS